MRTARQNIRLYPWYTAASSLLFWFPVFFLYFSSKVSIDQVLILEALYYFCVVLLEVPSGYISDLVGRRVTLLASSFCALVSYVVFFWADSFLYLAVAQLFFAAHMSLKSGTDSSLLYESLENTAREGEIGAHLAKAQQAGLFATAVAALAGGVAGGVDLGIPYALAIAGALFALGLAYLFAEPERSATAKPVIGQLRQIVTYLRQPILTWVFVFNIVIFILVHVPYEFFQPYIDLLFLPVAGYNDSPLVAGVLIALTMFAGAIASHYSMALQQRFGTFAALSIIVVIAMMIILAMTSILHVTVLLMLLMRNVPMSLANPIINTVVHQSIEDQIRASFLSVLSLLCRLCFSLTLLATAYFTGPLKQLDYGHLQLILVFYLIIGAIALPILLWAGSRHINQADQ